MHSVTNCGSFNSRGCICEHWSYSRLKTVQICILSLASVVVLSAQTTISGTVTDTEGDPVPFANVYIEDIYDGTSTDEAGKFSFNTDETGNVTLVVSCLGFEPHSRELDLTGEVTDLGITLASGATRLNEVVIAAGTFEASDERKATILSPLDIVQNPVAAGDLYGAIQTMPGVTQVGDETGIFVRGGEASETKTIIDGTIVDKPFFQEVPDIPSRGRFNPFLFKGTMFSTGGYSAEYGQALSSVLLLNTQDMPENSSTSVGLNFAGGSLARTSVKDDKVALLGSVNYTNLNPYFDLIPHRRDWVSGPVGWGGAAGMRRKWDAGSLFKTYAQFQTGKLALNIENPDDAEDPMYFDSQNDNFYWNSSFRGIIGEKWAIHSSLAVSRDVSDLIVDTADIENKDTRVQGKVTMSRELWPDAVLRCGGEVQWKDQEGRFEDFSGDQNSVYEAAYAETDIKLTSDLALRLGVRGEHESVLDKFNVAPRTSLAYKTGAQSQVSFAWGNYYQTPETDFARGISGLGYEKATHYIFNYQWLAENYTFRIEAYHKDYSDLIRYISPVRRDNSGSGWATGIDVFWRDKKTIPNLDYWISYSYIDSRRTYRDFPSAAMPHFITNHTLNFVSKYEIGTRLDIGVGYTFASGRPYTDPSTGLFLSERTDPYHNMMLNGSYLTTLFKNFTVIYISIRNPVGFDQVFDYRYSEDGSRRIAVVPDAHRFVFAGMFLLFQ